MHAFAYERSSKFPRIDMPKDCQKSLLDVADLTLLMQRLG